MKLELLTWSLKNPEWKEYKHEIFTIWYLKVYSFITQQ
jgi:hypothetical protein